jgi:pimeloyl-ACP methyl ester carboxylesterase
MKRQIFLLLSALLACSLAEGQSKGTDTIVDVGDARLHFRVIQGKGVPILFDAGGGDDGTVWDGILKPLAEITGTTLITYDRAGFGQSQIVETANDVSRHGILRN